MSDTEYRFTVRPLTEGGGWLVEYPDLPGCMSDGETVAEAIANAEDAKRCWIAAMKEAGRSRLLRSSRRRDTAASDSFARRSRCIAALLSARNAKGSASIPSPSRC
jgi:predicted RNase H-like HicB family nuclease